ATHTRRPRPVSWRPRPIVLVEGLWPWWDRKVAACYALKVYIDCPAELRFERRSLRDERERGRSPEAVRRQWRKQTEPMFALHVQPQADTADVIINAATDSNAVSEVASLVQLLVSGNPGVNWPEARSG